MPKTNKKLPKKSIKGGKIETLNHDHVDKLSKEIDEEQELEKILLAGQQLNFFFFFTIFN